LPEPKAEISLLRFVVQFEVEEEEEILFHQGNNKHDVKYK